MAVTSRTRELKRAAPLIEKLKSLCLRRGVNGFQGLVRAFRIFDRNEDMLIDCEELRAGLGNYGIVLSHDELELLLQAFDRNGDHRIDINEFLIAIQGGIKEERRAVVLAAFFKFDREGKGRVNLNDLVDAFSSRSNPLVLRGIKTQREVMDEFLYAFDEYSCPDGVVHLCEFEAYYAGIGTTVETDEEFVSMVLNTWALTQEDFDRVRNYESNVLQAAHLEKTANMKGSTKSGASMGNATSNNYNNNNTNLFGSTVVKSVRPEPPKRIVGYTGHVAGNIERFGVNFNTVQASETRPALKESIALPPEEIPPIVMIKKASRANAHSYRLE